MHEFLEPIYSDFEPVSENEIRAIESRLGLILPTAYKIFLLKYGRCMFSTSASIDVEGRSLSIFTWFGAGEKGNIMEDMNQHPEFFEAQLVPIADTEFNDRFVLDGSSGKIQYIEYSSGSSESKDISESFEQFVESIRFAEE